MYVKSVYKTVTRTRKTCLKGIRGVISIRIRVLRDYLNFSDKNRPVKIVYNAVTWISMSVKRYIKLLLVPVGMSIGYIMLLLESTKIRTPP